MNAREKARCKAQEQYDYAHAQAERNAKGQFATPPTLARRIVADALGRIDNPDCFLEPSCGTGSFVSAIREALPDIQVDAIEKDQQVFAIANDIWPDERTSIICDDFFESSSLDKGYDLLITNPPYTRHHHLSTQAKERYGSVVEQRTGRHLSQLAGLHAYFILAATSLLNDEGIASWLIPSELFSVNYGRSVRDYITSDVTIERLHFFDEADLRFDDALVSSCVLVLRKRESSDDDTVLISKGDFEEPSKMMRCTVGKLKDIEKWQHIFEKEDVSCDSCIGGYFTVKRGLSTGAESFYARQRHEWHQMGVDDRWLCPFSQRPDT